jgi:hypothetical protein
MLRFVTYLHYFHCVSTSKRPRALHQGRKILRQEGAQSTTGGINQTRRRRSSAIDQTWAYMEIDYVANVTIRPYNTSVA